MMTCLVVKPEDVWTQEEEEQKKVLDAVMCDGLIPANKAKMSDFAY